MRWEWEVFIFVILLLAALMAAECAWGTQYGVSAGAGNFKTGIDSLEAGDTLNVWPGTYVEAATAYMTDNDVLVRGKGSVPRDCRLVLSGSEDVLLSVLGSGATIENLKFTADHTLDMTTNDFGVIAIGTTANNTTLQSCYIETLRKVAGDEQRGCAIGINDADGCVLDDLFISDVYDSSTHVAGGGGVLATLNVAGLDVTNSIFTNCTSKTPFLNNSTKSGDQVWYKGCLFHDIDNIGNDSVFHLCGPLVGATDYRFIHNTFVDCDNGVAKGVVGDYTGAGTNISIKWCVSTDSNEKFYYDSGAGYDLDTLAHCTSYGQPFAMSGDVGTATDTIHQDPNYNSTAETATGYYRAKASACRGLTGGEYMGWELWPLPSLHPCGHHAATVLGHRTHGGAN